MDRKPVIMIAEDDRDLLWLYQRWLEEAGYFVRPAEDGAWALAELLPDPPDLLLLDLQMPTVNGFEVCQTLKGTKHGSPVPVIAMTAHLDIGMRFRAERCGADCVLMKPFSRTELILHVRRLLPAHQTEELSDRIQALERKVWAKLGNE